MNLSVELVPQDQILSVWEIVKPFINQSANIPDNGLYTVDHMLAFLMTQQWHLIVGFDENYIYGALAFQLIDHPLHRVAFITAVGGRGLINSYNYEKLKLILREFGATKLQGYGKPSILRLYRRLNINPVATLMEASI